MTEGIEAAADVATGAIVAAAVDGARAGSPRTDHEKPHDSCLNCGSPLSGAYCSECGQPAHIHRSFGSFWHDFSHSVLHFEGRFWRTLPELALHPGRLTRRYIDGERAKFISPMALYLFTVFLMYAVFSFTGGVKIGNDAGEEIGAGDPAALEEAAQAPASAATSDQPETRGPLARAFQGLTENPGLTSYKLKTNGYKYSWALVPLSIPFMWLLFFWRRDIFVYDHAIFVTYSISFMMLLVIAASLLRTMHVSAWIVTIVLQVVPPIHMYLQLRGAYGLSRLGALVRLVFLLFAAAMVLAIFVSLLFALGALG